MEEIKEEEKRENRHTTILLIANLIIWGIIVFMAILFNGVVHAQTTNVPMANYTVKWNGGYTNVNNNTQYTVSIPINEISFVFGNTEGVLVGTVWLTIDNTNIESPNDFKIIIFNNNTRDNTGTATKNCTITDGTSMGKKIRCQIDINITNTTQKYLQVNAKFEPSIAVLSKITANGQIVSTPAVQPATAEDIQSQTISIINNAIENSLNQSQAIIENQNQNTSYILQYMNQNKAELEATYTGQNANTTDLEDLEDMEDTLNNYTDVDLDDFEISIDTNTSNWVWNTLTSILNTSSMIFGYVISILSIGIIKLILNR